MSAAVLLSLFLLGGGASVSSPTSHEALRRAFLAGDLVTIERARAIRADRGEDTAVGPIALLHDLSRLVRCLPLGPVPANEEATIRAARMAARLERVRLERMLKDNVKPRGALAELLLQPPLYQWNAPPQETELVRWPIEQEVWASEVIESTPEGALCPPRPGALKEAEPKVHAANLAARARVEREMITGLLPYLSDLPDASAGRITLAYLIDGTQAKEFVLPAEWVAPLVTALKRGEVDKRNAGLILLARLRETTGGVEDAIAIYRELIADPTISDEQDSRVRTRLSALEEPDYERVIAVSHGARNPRDADERVLAYAEARALYALHRFVELRTFGRVWLRKPRGGNIFDDATRDLLLRLAVELDPAEAMAWIEEIGEDHTLDARLDELGRVAIESNNRPLATAVYDRLRLSAAAERARRGPAAAADEAKWIARRMLIEFAEEDAEAFAGFTDALVLLAATESEKPLARYAPHRELALLSQELIGRLTNEVSQKPERRKFAALLLEAGVKLAEKQSRFQRVLEDQAVPLRLLAGPYAVGRDGRAPPAARKTGKETIERKKKERKVKQLGEVIVPRLPPRIEAIDIRTAVPEIETFLVYEDESGALVAGVPWKRLAELRRAIKKRPKLDVAPKPEEN